LHEFELLVANTFSQFLGEDLLLMRIGTQRCLGVVEFLQFSLDLRLLFLQLAYTRFLMMTSEEWSVGRQIMTSRRK
jgi:hypothetical protein